MPNGLEPKPVADEPKSKPRWQSKTYWWGSGLIALALLILGSSEFQELVAQLPPEYAGWATGLIGLVTLILREVTKQAVH